MRTDIIYILDRSGSMQSVWDDARGGLESFIRAQAQLDGECNFTLVAFDDRYSVPVAAKPIGEVMLPDRFNIYPRGSTALYDAIGKTIATAGMWITGTPDKVICVIMTDGMENSSREYTLSQVREMIAHQREKYSWEFIFAGANIDAHKEAAAIDIAASNVLRNTHDSHGVKAAYASVNRHVGELRTNSVGSTLSQKYAEEAAREEL